MREREIGRDLVEACDRRMRRRRLFVTQKASRCRCCRWCRCGRTEERCLSTASGASFYLFGTPQTVIIVYSVVDSTYSAFVCSLLGYRATRPASSRHNACCDTLYIITQSSLIVVQLLLIALFFSMLFHSRDCGAPSCRVLQPLRIALRARGVELTWPRISMQLHYS